MSARLSRTSSDSSATRRRSLIHSSGVGPQSKRRSRRKTRNRRVSSRHRRMPIERLEDRCVLAATSFILGAADVQADSMVPIDPSPLNLVTELLADGGAAYTNTYNGTPFGDSAQFRTIGASQATQALTDNEQALVLTEPGTGDAFIFVYVVEGNETAGVFDITAGKVLLFTVDQGTFSRTDPNTWGAVDPASGELNTPIAEWDLKPREIVDAGIGDPTANTPAEVVNTLTLDPTTGLQDTDSRVLFREAPANDFIDVTQVSDNVPPFFADEGVFITADQSLEQTEDPLSELDDTAGAENVLNEIGEAVFTTTVTGVADGNFFADFSSNLAVGFTPVLGDQSVTGDFRAGLKLTLEPGVQFEAPQIHGVKYEDLDGDGVRDEGEPGLAGWTIVLEGTTLDGRDVMMTTTTDENGEYWFADDPETLDVLELVPGVYTVSEVLQSGWEQSFPNAVGTFLNLDGVTDSPPEAEEETQIVMIASEVGEDPRGEVGYLIELGDGRIVGDPDSSDEIDLPGADFGNSQLGSIHGYKFHDLDQDGVQDEGEDRLSGWTIYLDTDNNGQLDAGEMSMQTDSNGEYWFENLSLGDYIVREVLQPGWEQTAPSAPAMVTILSGQEYSAEQGQATLDPGQEEIVDPNLAFGNRFLYGSLHWKKFEDVDADGLYDPAVDQDWDSSKPQVSFQVTGPDGFDVTVTENTNGEYWLTELVPGEYTITEITAGLPDDVMSSEDSLSQVFTVEAANELAWEEGAAMLPDGSTQTESVPNPDNNGIAQTLVFGNYIKGSLHWKKFDDINGDGIYDPAVDQDWDAGHPQVSFQVTGPDGFDMTVTENTDGEYWLTELVPGVYTITEITDGLSTDVMSADTLTQQFTLLSGQELAWATGEAMLDPSALQTEVVPTPLVNGVHQPLVFGNFVKGSIHGIKFEDLDGDGVFDEGEPGVQGVTIYLDSDNNGEFDEGEEMSATTDANGEYWLTGLPLGDYLVREVVPEGWVPTAPASPVSLTITSGQEYVAIAGQAMLQPGDGKQEVLNPNLAFGNYRPGSIHGHKWNDLDGDGVEDASEPRLEGWTIYLDLDNNGALDAGEPSMETDSNGQYWFPDLAPGSYTVREVQQSGWVQTAPDSPVTITVQSGQEWVSLEGEAMLGENPLNKIEVIEPRLAFGNTLETGWIHGYKWHDYNYNGIWDEGETGLNNWVIYLDGSFPEDGGVEDGQLNWTDLNNDGFWDRGEGEQWVLTMDDPNHSSSEQATAASSGSYGDDHHKHEEPWRGAYWFDDVPAGTYTVREIVPPNWVQSYPGEGGAHSVTVVGGQGVYGDYGDTEAPNFGNYENKPGSIHGHVFHDYDMDGIWDEGEPGLTGYTVYIDLNNDGQRDFATEPIYTTMGSSYDDPYASDPYETSSDHYTREDDYSGSGSGLWGYSWSSGRGSWASEKPHEEHDHKDPHIDPHKGAYWIEGIDPGTYYIRVYAPGYTWSATSEALMSIPITIDPGQKYEAPYGATALGNIGIYAMPDDGDDMQGDDDVGQELLAAALSTTNTSASSVSDPDPTSSGVSGSATDTSLLLYETTSQEEEDAVDEVFAQLDESEEEDSTAGATTVNEATEVRSRKRSR